jgi:LPS-assembly protein
MRRRSAFALAAFIAASPTTPADAQPFGIPTPSPSAQTQAGDGNVFFKADSLRYDRELGVLVATGNVEFTRGDHVLMADTVSYNEKNETVTASGKVTLVEPTGEVVFADYVELTGDLRDGVMRNLRMRLQDDSRLAAAGGRRTGGNRTELAKAVYSPCDLCRDRPDSPPLWQIKAARVVHDQQAHDIIYNDAVVEVFGVPVAFLPYFQHPDPTVERRTGFLSPGFGGDSELGKFVRLPYYIDIAPNQDATLEPMMTTKEGPVMAGEYRRRWAHGYSTFNGSITEASAGDDEDHIRGHIKTINRFDFDRTWRGGLDIYRTTDDTYLRRYKFDGVDQLTSQAFVEGFRGRNYAQLRSYAFQGLRADDDPGQSPLVWPYGQYSFMSQPGRLGQYWTVDANMLQLTRSEGTDTRRLSVTPGWRLPVTTSTGEVYTLFARVQTDGYYADDLVDPHFTRPQSDFAGRVFPQVGIDWRYPFIRRDGTASTIVEPILGFVAGPNGGNSPKIPNEDSRDIELQDSNIFDPNRFPGVDRVDGGQRFYYGMKTSLIGLTRGGSSSLFLGQSYRVRRDDTFPVESGLEDHFSDFVGRLQVSPSQYLDTIYRFRIDKDSFEPRRHEVGAAVGPRSLRLSVNYIFLDNRPDQVEFRSPRKQVSGAVTAQITPNWSVGGGALRDLAAPEGNARALRHGVNVAYEDECLIFTADFLRNFTEDRDVKPSTTLFFRITLKTLGRLGFSGL